MTNWTPIERQPRSNLPRREALRCALVQRHKAGQAKISFPVGYFPTGDRCVIQTDGNGRLAFKVGDEGPYKVWSHKATGRREATIPVPYNDRIPRGSHQAPIVMEDGMFILDLTAFGGGKA